MDIFDFEAPHRWTVETKNGRHEFKPEDGNESVPLLSFGEARARHGVAPCKACPPADAFDCGCVSVPVCPHRN